MRTPLLSVLLLGLALGGCSARIGNANSSEDPNATGGSTGSGGGNMGPGSGTKPPAQGMGGTPVSSPDAGATAGFCAQLIPISAPAFDDLPAGPGFKLRVRVQVAGLRHRRLAVGAER